MVRKTKLKVRVIFLLSIPKNTDYNMLFEHILWFLFLFILSDYLEVIMTAAKCREISSCPFWSTLDHLIFHYTK